MALTLIPTPTADPPVGSNPGWVPGYVPSAVEWNDWWSRKVDVGDDSLVGGPFLSLAGGTMTGPLYLPAAFPTAADEAVNKAYVDSLTFATGPFMPQTGGTFTGPVVFGAKVTLAANPVDALDPATKGYVDASAASGNNALAVANAAVRRAGDTMTGLLTLSADPVNPMNAASKQYADTKLPFTGGTITGSLTVNVDVVIGRDLYVTNNLHINAFNSWEWSMYVIAATGDHIQQYRSQWYDYWKSAGGDRGWVGGDIGLMSLDNQGILVVRNKVDTTNIHAADQIYADGSMGTKGNLGVLGTVFGAALALNGGWAFYNNGASHIQQHVGGWYEYWNISGGHRGWVNNGTEVMSLNPSGSLSVVENMSASYIQSEGTVLAKGGLSALNGQMWMTAGGSGRIIQMSPNWYWDWNGTDGTLQWVRDSGGGFFVMRTADNFCYNNLGPIGGSYFQQLSDERTKADIIPAGYGLSEVMALEPIEFTRINDGSKREVGFSAQQMRGVIPAAVHLFGAKLPDGTGGLDTDEPTLGIDIIPVVAALVNGMKELAAEVAALKAAR